MVIVNKMVVIKLASLVLTKIIGVVIVVAKGCWGGGEGMRAEVMGW